MLPAAVFLTSADVSAQRDLSPPHSLLLERSQLKLSHSQYFPLYTSAEFSRFLHSQVPQTQSPLLLQISVPLSFLQLASRSSVRTSSLLHSQIRPMRPSLHLGETAVRG